ncbi:MAG: DUF1501 domain-containing protein [Pirellulaceae bacterium]|jgi:hypothetical protein|nr:DUF1501 domain-containing protein [Pirellulaceae bacterium]MDP7018591.1 DUF1501 domain-containing protein [Pirellulaceae bacterium]
MNDSPARPTQATAHTVSRRLALQSFAAGAAQLTLMGQSLRAEGRAAANPLAAKPPHFPARAKRVILLCMNGGPSQVDLFDYKPQLRKDDGRPMNGRNGARLMKSPFQFAQHGESGHWMSELLPNLAKRADDLCVVNSMQTDLPNHSQAFTQMHTGSFQFIRPSLGAWVLHGLGTENTNLPGFVTLSPPADNGGSINYGNAFLPDICQATKIGTNQIPGFYAALLGVDREPGPPLRNVENTLLNRDEQRAQLDLIRSLNAHKLKRDVYHPEISGAIESFELAFRMQDEIPDLLDLGSESSSMLAKYGVGAGLPTDRFGRQCLLARRLAEAGTRFIEVTSPAGWDHHFRLKEEITESCQETDQPIAALLADLKQRGLLDDTLVIWAGEFGRTPYAQSGTGRDHNNHGYTVWMAGGGVKPGLQHGATDEYGYRAVEDSVHIHDWHATILHLLGLDHERLTFNYGGRDFRLTDVHGRVVAEIVA